MNKQIFSDLRVITDRKTMRYVFLTYDGVNISHLPKITLHNTTYTYQQMVPTFWDYSKYRSPFKCVRHAGNIVVLVDRTDPLLRKHMQKINAIISSTTVAGMHTTKDMIKLLLWDRSGKCIGRIYIVVHVDKATQKTSIRYYCKKNNYRCFKFISNIVK